jgi:2-iminobutanoate/2-iminopropanoate deaminase
MQIIQSQQMAPPGGHYSHAVHAGGLLFISGQLPINAQGEALHKAAFETHAQQTLANLDAILQAAQLSRSALAQVRVYMVGIEHWPTFNTLYAQWIGVHRPARAVVPVPQLHYGCLIEIEAVAIKP